MTEKVARNTARKAADCALLFVVLLSVCTPSALASQLNPGSPTKVPHSTTTQDKLHAHPTTPTAQNHADDKSRAHSSATTGGDKPVQHSDSPTPSPRGSATTHDQITQPSSPHLHLVVRPAPKEAKYKQNSFIVCVHANDPLRVQTSLERTETALKKLKDAHTRALPLIHGFVVDGVPGDMVVAALKEANLSTHEIAFIEHNFYGTASSSWPLDAIDPQAQSQQQYTFKPTYTGKGVRVYVVDSGVDVLHTQKPKGATWAWGVDTSSNSGQVKSTPTQLKLRDCAGHGTMVAGLVSQVAADADVIAVKVSDCTVNHEFPNHPTPLMILVSDFVNALIWIDKDINGKTKNVVNLSLGWALQVQAVDRAVTTLVQADNVVGVIAAGNNNVDVCDGQNNPNPASPAHLGSTVPQLLVVSGCTQALDFHNLASGSCVSVLAPSDSIPSTTIDANGLTNGQTAGSSSSAVRSGSSYAAPIVSGVAAQWYEKLLSKGKATATDVVSEIKQNVVKGRVRNVPTGTTDGLVQIPT